MMSAVATQCAPAFAPDLSGFGRVWRRKAKARMQVILHIGAHLTGARRFQSYVKAQRGAMKDAGLSIWGAERTRRGLFDGLLLPSGAAAADQRARGRGRVQLNCARLMQQHQKYLVVSEPNMMGTLRDNLRQRRLYPGVGERMARFADAFGAPLRRVVLTIASPDRFWEAALAELRGRSNQRVPDALCDELVTQPRSWRGVIEDLACALPETSLLVAPAERMASRPDILLEYMTEGQLRAPEAASMPDREIVPAVFSESQRWALQEIYAADLDWLRAGASGCALWIEEGDAQQGSHRAARVSDTRGHEDDQERGLG